MMGMMMGGKGGAPASMPVAEDLKDLIEETAKLGKVRYIKVGIDKKRPRLLLEDQVEASPDFCADFERVDWANWLQDATATIVLCKTTDEKGTVTGATPNTFLFMVFMPEGVPVRQKTGFSSALSSMKQALPDINFKEWNVSEREEVTCKDAIDLGREQTDEERRAQLSAGERAALEHQEQADALNAEYEKKRKRLVSLHGSFEDAFLEVLDEKNKAVIAKMISFPDQDTVELGGEVMAGAGKATDLRGKLPKDDALFVILREDTTLLIVHWKPEGASEDRKLKSGSIVAKLTDAIQGKAGKDFDLCMGEACVDDDLNDNLGVE